jgi:hypothetical protein
MLNERGVIHSVCENTAKHRMERENISDGIRFQSTMCS